MSDGAFDTIWVVTETELIEWEQLAQDQKRSRLIGYEWAEKTRPLLNAVIRLTKAHRSLAARLAKAEGNGMICGWD